MSTEAGTLRHLLDGGADVAQRGPFLDLGQTGEQGLLGGLEQQLGARRDLANGEGPGIVAVPTIDDGAGIDAYDVAFLQDDALAGNAMHDLAVDTGTDGTRETAVSLEAGDTTLHADDLLRIGIDIPGADTRSHDLARHTQGLGAHTPGFLHGLDLTLCLEDDPKLVPELHLTTAYLPCALTGERTRITGSVHCTA